MKRFLALLALVLFAIGCTTHAPNYLFTTRLPHAENWKSAYPVHPDPNTPYFRLVNGVTGERIYFFLHLSLNGQPESLACDLKVAFALANVEASDVMVSPSGRIAHFHVRYANGDLGQAAVFQNEHVNGCVVAIGQWPAAHDAEAVSDMNIAVATMDVQTE